MAAMSAALWTTARAPICSGVDQSKRKCRPATAVSVLTTTGPAPASTAASSPDPITTSPSASSRSAAAAVNRAIIARSPTSPTVCTAPTLRLDRLVA